MKVAFLGDLHIGAGSNNKDIWANQYQFFQFQFLPYLEQNSDIKMVIQTGDFFDSRSAVPHVAMHNGQWVAEEIAKRVELHVLVGNHDIPFKNTNNFDSVDPIIGHIDGVQVYQWPGDKNGIMIVPWISPGNTEQVMGAIAKTKAKYLVGHFDVIGGKFNKHDRKSEHGVDPNAFKKFDRVISGHYHTKSRISNIDFVGTPYELDWNDWDDPKGFHIFDTETNELTFIHNYNNLFYKVVHTETGVETIPDNPSGKFEGKFVKVESASQDREQIRKVIDQVGVAANVQTILTKEKEVVTIEDVSTKSVTQALVEAAQKPIS